MLNYFSKNNNGRMLTIYLKTGMKGLAREFISISLKTRTHKRTGINGHVNSKPFLQKRGCKRMKIKYPYE